jgi:hypothetical protein
MRCPMHLYNLVLDGDPTIFPRVMFGDLFLCIALRCQCEKDSNNCKRKVYPSEK